MPSDPEHGELQSVTCTLTILSWALHITDGQNSLIAPDPSSIDTRTRGAVERRPRPALRAFRPPLSPKRGSPTAITPQGRARRAAKYVAHADCGSPRSLGTPSFDHTPHAPPCHSRASLPGQDALRPKHMRVEQDPCCRECQNDDMIGPGHNRVLAKVENSCRCRSAGVHRIH